MAEVHNEGKRMLLILDGEYADRWLDPSLSNSQIKELMRTFPYDDKLEAFRTVNGVTNARVNTNVLEVIKPLVLPNTYDDLPLFAPPK